MGATNAHAALAVADVPDAAMRVLVKMALVSMDADSPPRYFAGWEVLAAALGRPVEPVTPDMSASEMDDTERANEGARRAVGRAMKRLVDVGAVTRVNVPNAGRRAEYALHLTCG